MTFTTRANVKERLGIATATTDFDDLIDQLIVEVSGMFDDLIGRDLDSSARTEYYDGTGTDTLWLRHGPLATVAGVWSVVYDDDGADNRTETATELTEPNRLEWGLSSEGHIGQSAIVYNSGRFTRGRRNWKVTYTAGYASVPASLEKAATYEVVADFLTRETSGLASKVIGDAQQNQLTPVQRRMALERAVSPVSYPGDRMIGVYVKGAVALSDELGRFVRDMRRLRLAQALTTSAKWVQSSARQQIGSGKLQSRTGRLRASITWELKQRRGELRAEIGPSGFPQMLYGWIHETGATEWPVRQFLTPGTERNRERIFRLIGKVSKFGTNRRT